MSQFTVVPDDLRRGESRGPQTDETKARNDELMAGKTLFVQRRVSNKLLRARGYRPVSRAHTLDGVKGFLIWAEPPAATPATTFSLRAFHDGRLADPRSQHRGSFEECPQSLCRNHRRRLAADTAAADESAEAAAWQRAAIAGRRMTGPPG